MINPKELQRRWVHSHEEDTSEVSVYRPAGFPFPPSRGRHAFELRADGTATEGPIAAADGNQSLDGRWQLRPDGALVLTDANGKQLRELRIKELAGNRLSVAR
jgi:hypothetical protein